MSRDDERDRPSWRDLDARRNQSAHTRDEGGPRGRAPRVESATATYRRQLDAFFDRGVVPEGLKSRLPKGEATEPSGRQKLVRQIRDAQDLQVLGRAIDALLKEYGMPEADPELWLQMLQHSDEGVLSQLVTTIEQYVQSGQQLPRKPRFASGLRAIEARCLDTDLQERARRLAMRLR